MPKQAIRNQMLTRRSQCDALVCRALGQKIQSRFLELASFASAGCLALYSPIRNEVDTSRVAEATLKNNKRLVYPRVSGDQLEFVQVFDLQQLTRGSFDVLEPRSGVAVDPAEIDLCVVPGVVFDRRGHRLGYGCGFYDRFLSLCREHMVRAGFAYDFQIVENLPTGEYDQSLSVIVTETATLNFRR